MRLYSSYSRVSAPRTSAYVVTTTRSNGTGTWTSTSTGNGPANYTTTSTSAGAPTYTSTSTGGRPISGSQTKVTTATQVKVATKQSTSGTTVTKKVDGRSNNLWNFWLSVNKGKYSGTGWQGRAARDYYNETGRMDALLLGGTGGVLGDF